MKNIIKIFFTKVVNYLTNNSHIEKEHQKFLERKEENQRGREKNYKPKLKKNY